MKALVFDSGTLINLSMNGLLDTLETLKKKFNGKFLITKDVKYEIVDRPIGISRFELGALRVQNLIDTGIIEMPSSAGISDLDIEKRTKIIEDIANHCVQIKGRWITIVSKAEMSCLALVDELEKKGIESIIAIDERTTRMLSERPENMEKMMSEKMHHKVNINEQKLKAFSKYRFIRSSELVFVAYKKGLINLQGKKVLEALLYATKFKGAAISFEEINELKRL